MLNKNLEFNQAELIVDKVVKDDREVVFLSRNNISPDGYSTIEIKDMLRFVALKRLNNYWNIPCFGDSSSDLPKETQFLLWENKSGQHCLLLPLVDRDVRTTLEGSAYSPKVVWEGELPGQEVDTPALLAFACGSNPYKLIKDTVKVVSDYLKTFRIREEKHIPEFVDYFGWCTWDAFYNKVTEEDVLNGLESFSKGSVQPGFMILDDGWQDVCNENKTLKSFDANNKFPNGLLPLVNEAKNKYGIKKFGVWHAFEGYWSGVDPEGSLAKDYEIVPNQKTVAPKPGETVGQTYYLKLLSPVDIHRFYNDYYYKLRQQGVDMVKVDNQSSLQDFTNNHFGRGSAMRRYQEAFQGASQNYFSGNTIHCMSNCNDVAYNMNSAVVWRNSDDYYPKRGIDVQQDHIFNNSINALWTSTFSLPDWDMFQSHGTCAEMHAAARAISGGPVYVCDSPGKQDFSILEKLVVDKSKVLHFDTPALPSPECIYVDGRVEAQAMKIWTRRADIGVLGVFACQHDGAEVATALSSDDIPEMSGDKFAVYLFGKEELVVVDACEKIELTLAPTEWEIATFSPIQNNVAPLGLLNKYAGAAVLQNWFQQSENEFVCEVSAGGELGFFSETSPKKVIVNGIQFEFDYDETNCLLKLENLQDAHSKVILQY
jgi:raffinose synthase